MRIMSRATKHVWFERSEVRDRQFVSKRIMEHVSDLNNFPVLLFPEGTCINNTSVMMFKKGSFEMPTTIYPVAIKVILSANWFSFGDACSILSSFVDTYATKLQVVFLQKFVDQTFLSKKILLKN